jgi:hypothetical protein
MSDHKIQIQFVGGDDNISDMSGNNNASFQYLADILSKLNSSIDKLNLNFDNKAGNAVNSESNKEPKYSRNPEFDRNPNDFPNDEQVQVFQDWLNKQQQSFNQIFSSIGASTGKLIGATLLTGLTVTATRYMNNEANAIMGRATSQGGFIQEAIKGNANQSFNGYIANLYSVNKEQQISNNLAKSQGIWGTVGGIGGGILGGLTGGIAGFTVGNLPGLAVGTYEGAKYGSRYGKYGGALLGGGYGTLSAAEKNQKIEVETALKSAISERMASASVSEWSTGFSRFGLNKSNYELASSKITGGSAINAPLSAQFEKKYGSDLNYNSILNNIVPYMGSNPLNENLSAVAQNFTKAGFAVDSFAKLTTQATQYQIVTGKSLESFSEDIKDARNKFGYGYSEQTNQTALNLMTIGYSKDLSRELAYNSQYNPHISSAVSEYANEDISQFARNEALKQAMGIDWNTTLRTGKLSGKADKINELVQHAQSFMSGDTKDINSYGLDLAVAGKFGFSPEKIIALNRERAQVFKNPSNDGLDASENVAQKLGVDIITSLQQGLKDISSLQVSAQHVTVIDNGGNSSSSGGSSGGYTGMSPMVHPKGTDPTKNFFPLL